MLEGSLLELLDMSKPGIRAVIERAQASARMTYDELNELLPSEEMAAEEIDEVVRSVNAAQLELREFMFRFGVLECQIKDDVTDVIQSFNQYVTACQVWLCQLNPV